MLENKSPNRDIRNPVRHSLTAKEALRNSRSLPLKNLSRIVGNYTRRNTTRLIPPKANFSKIFEHPTEDFSELLKTEEDLLNTLRSSPPKAEISLNDITEEETPELKKMIKEERAKYLVLEQNYKELLSQFIQNESRYKKRIAELEEKIINNDPSSFVHKQDFEKLSERVALIEKYFSASLPNFK